MAAAISLLMTVYNRDQWVGAAVQSVLAQTRSDFELIVWDDGSTDESIAAATKAAASDPRVRIASAEHQGLGKSLNAAAALASGEYLGWIDSDDLLAPTALAETAAILESRPAIGMVYTDYLVMDEAGNVKGPGSRCQIPYSKDRLLLDFMVFHFRLMRRELFISAGGVDPNLAPAEDYDLCLKLSEITEIHQLKRPLYYYRVHRRSASHEQRIKQILSSREAIARALQRRGMAERYEVDVEIRGQFSLREKQGGPRPLRQSD